VILAFLRRQLLPPVDAAAPSGKRALAGLQEKHRMNGLREMFNRSRHDGRAGIGDA
jgi:hypothetical protein